MDNLEEVAEQCCGGVSFNGISVDLKIIKL
jgi:hypothetical protein